MCMVDAFVGATKEEEEDVQNENGERHCRRDDGFWTMPICEVRPKCNMRYNEQLSFWDV